ncbi:LNS2-domain-containing protein [Hygrophoropsis aurantiaca]|uniref:LNS2-domain-containing protein n=1 Tax=Hygrophoropsis aurantiaca TaxID=72124 RepID=A0ACB8A2Q4_9AGAM|nr:LNS2-domain-containing protein [Hygrophoropsis aurantiaca]
MNYIRGAVSAISAPYQYYRDLAPINPSTLTGAIDVIVIRRPGDAGDVVLACSPFHVRFGKLQVLRPAEKKVNIFVNGNPIPFSMKIGDAGEAFFVFETEEDIPEDLVTSPILQATQTAKDVDVESDRFGAQRPQGDVTVKVEPKDEMQEPEFLDLNASLDSPPNSQILPPTDTPTDPSDHVDEASRPGDNLVIPPTIQYADGVALDMEGYHSHERDGSGDTVTPEGRNQSTHNVASTSSSPIHRQEASRSPSPETRVPFPSLPGNRSLLNTAFSSRRAISESPEDLSDPKLHDAPNGDASRQQEYSWEWGAFPQPSPLTPHFSNSGSAKGKSRAPMRADSLNQEHEDDLTLLRSHSVPPELEGSPHTIRTALPPVDDHHQVDAVEESDGFGSGGMLSARPDDPTKFQVWIEGKVVDFELSLVSSTEVFKGPDELEAARIFEKGKIDYRRLVSDESVVRDAGLVIKWAGGQYVVRSDCSPLMDALQLWCAAAPRDHLESLPAPIAPEDEPVPTMTLAEEAEAFKRAESEPPESSRKPTSTSWVRWWSRSRGIEESESSTRPALRPSATVPLDKHAPKPSSAHPPSHFPAASASVPSPSTPAEGKSPAIEPLGEVLRAKIARTQKKFAKTLRLSSDQLKSLNLNPGPNTITFSLSTTGAPACTARIFVWESTDLVVVSDIDGTITKSDGLGHIFTMIGRDWTHLGVAKLYTDIRRNGYRIMYLTSRAIGQADSTRDYLKGIKQNDYQLPEGPVIMSPDRLMASLHREVIMRKPEVFKMACLRDIQRLFGEATRSPFYAGFGNRITDALSYRSVNIPSARIFTIDSSGEVKMELLELAGYKSSYIHMTDLVDQMFPPIHRKWAAEFTDFNYWKQPVQEFPLPDLTPPSPALSARSDTSNQSALARLRNFSLVGTRQSNNMKQFNLPLPATAPEGTPTNGAGHRNSHLRQMSSLERLSNRLAALTQSSSSSVDESGLSVSPVSRSSSSTFLDSDEEEDDEGGISKGKRPRSRSMTSMPGSLDDDMQFGGDSDGDVEEGYGYDDEGVGEGESGENEEEAAEEAFDEDFFTTSQMNKVPFP